MDEATRELVRRRAGDRCEYCLLPQAHSPLVRHHVEHIVPKKHGGTDDPGNLALACIDCNLRKGPNLAGLDPLTGSLTELFDPRRHEWDRHFDRSGIRIEGLTPIGRTTVTVLGMNTDDRIELRLEVCEP